MSTSNDVSVDRSTLSALCYKKEIKDLNITNFNGLYMYKRCVVDKVKQLFAHIKFYDFKLNT